MAFFNVHRKLQGNAWTRQDLSPSFPKFQLWPCTGNYIKKIDFITSSSCVSENFVRGTSLLLALTSSMELTLLKKAEILKVNEKPTGVSNSNKILKLCCSDSDLVKCTSPVLLWNPSGPPLGELLCSAIFTRLKHVLLIQCVLSHSLTSIKLKLSRKTWKSTLILISSARNKPGYQEFKPHTAQMNAAAYNIQQGCVFPLCEG